MKRYSLLTLWVPVLVWMGIIFALSSRQRIGVSEEWALNFAFFKSLHLIEYAFLFFLSRRALRYGSGVAERYSGIGALIIVFLYAASDEFHQRFVPTREGAFRDVIIDCLGASIAWIVLTRIEPVLPKKLKLWVKRWQIL